MSGGGLVPVGTAELQQWLARLALPSPADGDADRIDRLRVLEQVKNAICAAQAAETLTFNTSQRDAQVAAGYAPERVGQGIAEQVALARMVSPWKGNCLLGLARALNELPECSAALTRGEVSEWKISVVVREIIHLDPDQRALVDAELGPTLKDLGDREAAGQARAWAHRLDPASAVQRAAKAATDRRVSIRPAPDCMTYVTALLPVRDGVVVYAAVQKLADQVLAEQSESDTRGTGAIMADAFVERVTGRECGTVPIRLGIVMTDAALIGAPGDCGLVPASVSGYGTVPGQVARAWIRELISTRVVPYQHLVAVNRLFTHPASGDLVAMETTNTSYTGLLRHMLTLRDQHCRTPWCDAPIRHIDHIHRRTNGGPTSYRNGRAVCAGCNHAREAPGWTATVTSGIDEPHHVTLTTPTGHTYPATPPPLIPTTRPAAGPGVPKLSTTEPRAGPRRTRAG